MCLGTFSRRARSLATYFFFARVRIPRSAFWFYRKCNAISYKTRKDFRLLEVFRYKGGYNEKMNFLVWWVRELVIFY